MSSFWRIPPTLLNDDTKAPAQTMYALSGAQDCPRRRSPRLFNYSKFNWNFIREAGWDDALGRRTNNTSSPPLVREALLQLEHNYFPTSPSCHFPMSQSFVFLSLMTSRFNTNCFSPSTIVPANHFSVMENGKQSKYWRWNADENIGRSRQRRRRFCLTVFCCSVITNILSIIRYLTVYTD